MHLKLKSKLRAFKASRGHPSKVVKLPIMLPGVEDIDYLLVKHLKYHRFHQVVPVNRICVVMSCLEMNVGKSHEIAFSMTVKRDFQCQSFKSSL